MRGKDQWVEENQTSLGSFPTLLHCSNSSCLVSSLNISEVGFYFAWFLLFFQLFFSGKAVCLYLLLIIS